MCWGTAARRTSDRAAYTYRLERWDHATYHLNAFDARCYLAPDHATARVVFDVSILPSLSFAGQPAGSTPASRS